MAGPSQSTLNAPSSSSSSAPNQQRRQTTAHPTRNGANSGTDGVAAVRSTRSGRTVGYPYRTVGDDLGEKLERVHFHDRQFDEKAGLGMSRLILILVSLSCRC